MNQGNIRRWLLPGALAVTSLLGAACQREETWRREDIPRTGGPYQGIANDGQTPASFGPGTGGSGFSNIAPVQDRVGENLPPTAVGNVPPRVLPGIAAGNPEAVKRFQQQGTEPAPKDEAGGAEVLQESPPPPPR